VKHLFALPFDRPFSQLSGEDFVNVVLKKSLNARHVVVGPDFSFGRGRSGSVKTLETAGSFGVTCLPHVSCGESERFSSTRIRAHIAKAELEKAAGLLGRPWEVEAEIIPGDRRGRTIGFPTANQDTARYARLPYGIYAVRVLIEGEEKWRDGVASFGIRPMFEVKRPLLETYIFDFAEEIYGKQMRVRPVRYLRPELNLPDLAALKARIDRDCVEARAVLKSASL
jgi:riboflavin kinase/FMN adenylyltransferase